MGGGEGGVGEKLEMLFSFPFGVFGLAIWGFHSNCMKTRGVFGGAEGMGIWLVDVRVWFLAL